MPTVHKSWVLGLGLLLAAACQPSGGGGGKTCASAGATCGSVDDGNGGTLDCGSCASPQTCGGGGTPNQCGCAPRQCVPGDDCGAAPDGCGGTLNCGVCTDATDTCGGGGTPFKCGCTPIATACSGLECGDVPDGCGGMTTCGTCTAPEVCNNHQCSCTPTFTSCGQANAFCGTLDNGCGTPLTCPGTCNAPETCGGAGEANRCGCTPIDCAANGIECGVLPDGCGGMKDCGGCMLPETCGGGGTQFLCGCIPTPCPSQFTCGTQPDGCGGFAQCGTPPVGGGDGCTGGQVCGGGGSENVCATVQPYLANVHPRLLNAGATLYLEGTFGPTVTVNFEGVAGPVTATATVLGLRRATVAVPLNAITGLVSVTSAGVTTPGLPIQVARFTVGLQPFNTLNPQTAGARQASRLVTARDHHQVLALGPYIYALGGRSNNTVLQSVERATVSADGAVSAFVDAGVSLTTARERFGIAVLGSYLYVIGGVGAQHHQSVERALINPDYTLGGFQTVSGVDLATGRRDFGVEVLGNYVYIIGGAGEEGAIGTTERAQFRFDGTLSDFSIVGSALVIPRTTHRTAIAGNSLFVIGGLDAGGTTLGSIERAPINADGSLGQFAVEPATLVAARMDHATAVVGDALFVVGGRSGGVPVGSVERATLGPDGSLGAFGTVVGVALQVPRHGHAVVARNGVLIAVGGKDTTGSFSTVETASLLDTGDMIPFQAVGGATLITPRSHHGTLMIGDRLWVVGGTDGVGASLKTLEYADVAADGTPGPFTAALSQLVTARSGAAVMVAHNKLYVVAGDTNGTALGTVEAAPINADGSLGTFAIVPNITLLQPRTEMAYVATARGLHLVGGRNGNTYLTSVERTPVNATALGPFENVAAATLGTPRAHAASIVSGGHLYVLGGMTTGGTVLSSIERTPIALTDGALGAFEPVTQTLGTLRRDPTVMRAGYYLYVLGGSNGTAALNTVERALVGEDGSLAIFSPYATAPLLTAREAHGTLSRQGAVLVVGGKSTVALGSTEKASTP